jgi:hypothetical protein
MMRALTLRRPWAGAIAHLGKRVENRCHLAFRGAVGERIAIHAGKTHVGSDVAWHARRIARGEDAEPTVPGYHTADLDAQGIVCTALVRGWVAEHDDGEVRYDGDVTEADALATLLDPWWCGPVGYLLTDVRVLATPVPCRGAQGLWRVPADVEALVLARGG